MGNFLDTQSVHHTMQGNSRTAHFDTYMHLFAIANTKNRIKTRPEKKNTIFKTGLNLT